MALFGSGVPSFVADGETITLPTPTTRKDFPIMVKKIYTGVNDNLIEVLRGYRWIVQMEFTDVSQTTFESILKIANADVLLLNLSGMPMSWPVKLTKLTGGYEDNIEIDVMEIEIQKIDLLPHIPNPDDYWTLYPIINAQIFMPEPETLNYGKPIA